MSIAVNQIDILIIGAGASGLMAARDLSKAGKKVLILEARNRIGGRIMPLNEGNFGYPAQGGAEFVHGEAPITKALILEAGLTYVPEAEDGEVWSTRSGPFSLRKSFFEDNDDILKEKLENLNNDISVADFLRDHFSAAEYTNLRNSALKMVEGYEAADPQRISASVLKIDLYHSDGWIKEGYGQLLDFLKKECEQNGVSIILNTQVTSVDFSSGEVIVETSDGTNYKAAKAIVTVPVPVLKSIVFTPELSEKMALVSNIGFGSAIKLLITFKRQWWKQMANNDLSKLSFALCNDDFTAWWTQYPRETNVMVGWMAGLNAEKNKNLSDTQLLELGLSNLSNIFSIDKKFLEKEIELWKVINWSNDPYALGAYSYTAMETANAQERLAEPVNNMIFFAGEALYSGVSKATVEGALGSGKEIAALVLKFFK